MAHHSRTRLVFAQDDRLLGATHVNGDSAIDIFDFAHDRYRKLTYSERMGLLCDWLVGRLSDDRETPEARVLIDTDLQ